MAARTAIALLFVVLLAPAAGAAVPSPFNCTVPAFAVGSPDGAYVTRVVVRDIANNPLYGATVALSFSGCSTFRPCPSACTGCAVNVTAETVQLATDITGTAAFDLRIGGSGCPNPPAVLVYADGIYLGTTNFASLDQDGDLSVTAADVAQAQSLLGSADLRADFDGDHVVTAADVAAVQARVGVTCNPPTPTRSRTWGTLKTIYR